MRPFSRAVCQSTDVPLILGGHSFISQLGTDAPTTPQQQREIVESCLDRGITWIDTTYQPERVALGAILQSLGRREEATILAWNFFTDFGPTGPVGQSEYYRPHHIEQILEQLQTACVDILVLVEGDDIEENARQRLLLTDWRRKGYVRALGLWIPDLARAQEVASAFQFAVAPFNVARRDAPAIFAACKRAGLQTLATSPFIRGLEIDRLVTAAKGAGEVRSRLADLMLRYVLFHGDVDRVVVGMRKTEWIAANLESVKRGPLSDEEREWLESVQARKAWNGRWERLRHLLGGRR